MVVDGHLRTLALGALVGLSGCVDLPALDFQELADATANAPDLQSEGTQDANRPEAPDGPANTPDARVDSRDALTSMDATSPNDALAPAFDGNAPTPDLQIVVVDAMTLPTDAPTAHADAPIPAIDAMRPDLDAVVSPTDAVAAPSDARPAGPDGVAQALDGLVVVPDAFTPEPDAFTATPDVFVPVPDVFVPEPDAFIPEPDAFVPPPTVIVRVPGPEIGLNFGRAVVVVPDQNGDGFADVIVGAPAPANEGARGVIFLLNGQTGAVLGSVEGHDGSTDLGSVLLTVDLTGDGTVELVTSAPTASAGRGKLYAFNLPDFESMGEWDGGDAGGHIGTALSLIDEAEARELPSILASAPNTNNFSPRVYAFQVTDQAGASDFVRTQRINAEVIAPVDFGSRILGAPATDRGDVGDFIVIAGNGDALTPRRALRFREGSPAQLETEYLPRQRSALFGSSLIDLPGAAPLIAIGQPDANGGGVVHVFRRDVPQNEAALLELVAAEPSLGFGTALAAAPHLVPGEARVGLCVGAPGSAQIPGRVECSLPGTREGYVEFSGAPAEVSFGASLSVSVALDPDGCYLLAVGAPDGRPNREPSGAVILHRVTPRP